MVDNVQNHNLNIAIIGCGNIASGLDESSFNADFPKTHLGALSTLQNYNIVGICDSDLKRVNQVKEFWKIPFATNDINKLLELNIDVLTIALGPGQDRVDIIDKCVQKNIKLLFCEKPLANSLKEAEQISKLIKGQNTKFLINFSRRFDDNIQMIKKNIENLRYGSIQKIICNYGKGLSNNGSHMLDLLFFFAGSPSAITNLGKKLEENGDYENTDALISYKNFPVFFTSQDSTHYSCFEMDIFFTQGRIRINQHGREIHIDRITPDKDFPTYQTLISEKIETKGLQKCFSNAYQEIYNNLTQNKSNSSSSITDSIEILKLIEELD